MAKTGKQIKHCRNLSWCPKAVQNEEQNCDSWHSSSVQDTHLESTVTSILSDIDVHVKSRDVEDCHRIGESNNGSKKTVVRFSSRKYWKHPYFRNALKHVIMLSINLVAVA